VRDEIYVTLWIDAHLKDSFGIVYIDECWNLSVLVGEGRILDVDDRRAEWAKMESEL